MRVEKLQSAELQRLFSQGLRLNPQSIGALSPAKTRRASDAKGRGGAIPPAARAGNRG